MKLRIERIKSMPTQYKAILIGGPKDGTYFTLPEKKPYYRVPVYSEASSLCGLYNTSPAVCRAFEYRLLQVAENDSLLFYADPSLSPGQVFEKLLEGYSPRHQP